MMIKPIKFHHLLFFVFFIFIGGATSAAEVAKPAFDDPFFDDEVTFLDVDDAFAISSELFENEIIVRWKIADEYYLYKHRFSFTATGAELSEPIIPDGEMKNDEYFGEVEVYHKHIEISVPFKNAESIIDLTVKYQGCAEAGLCYTPQTRHLFFERQADGQMALSSGVDTKIPGIDLAKDTASSSTNNQTLTDQSKEDESFVGEAESLTSIMSQGNFFWTLMAFLGAGLLLTFTPCVLPMIPILSGIIAGQGKDITPAKAFRLSFVYVQAMAITYAVLGVLVAQAGSSLSGYLQSPVILSFVAGIFVVLAFSMFGHFELKLPSFIHHRVHGISEKQRGGNYISVAVMGVISTLIVSPCTSAPLTAALLFIANSGDTWAGGLSLYFLGLGMGIPLLLIGVSEGRLLPSAGAWMEKVKLLFGFMMLGMALYITSHLIPGPLYLLLWAILFINAAVFFGAFTIASSGSQMVQKSFAIIIFLLGVIYLVGATLGNGQLLKPLAGVQTSITTVEQKKALEFKKVSSLDELNLFLQQAKQTGRPVMIDFFAEWCVACFELEDYTFTDPKVLQFLQSKNTLLLQADVTANSELDLELMQHFKIFGLPAILFFDKNGEELTKKRVTGFEDAETFLQRLQAIL